MSFLKFYLSVSEKYKKGLVRCVKERYARDFASIFFKRIFIWSHFKVDHPNFPRDSIFSPQNCCKVEEICLCQAISHVIWTLIQ